MEPKPAMNPTSSAADAHRGRFIPWMIAGFFLVFVLLLLSFVWIAFAHKPSLVTENAYQKGLAYNHAIEASAAQKALGWKGRLDIPGGKSLLFTLNDARGKPISGAQVKAWIVRPASAAMDLQVTLNETSPGHYAAPLALSGSGLWESHVTALYNKQQYQISKSFEAP